MKALHLILLSCLAGSLQVLSAQTLAGKWTGTLFQDPSDQFYCELNLQPGPEGSYSGTSLLRTRRDQFQGMVSFRISLRREEGLWLYRDENILLDERDSDDFFWCYKRGQLRLSREGNTLYLTGPWQAESCMPGTFSLSKKIPPKPKPQALPPQVPPQELAEREIEAKETLSVTARTITLEVWDHNREDGDVISLNLNGHWILRNHRLTKAKHRLTVTVLADNLLVLHAENLGLRPPNTAAISIDDGQEVREILLKSDKGTSEAIRILGERE